MPGNAGKDVSEPGLRIDIIELGGADQGIHDGGALPATPVPRSQGCSSDCAAGEVCDPIQRGCVVDTACTTSAECGAFGFCVDGACASYRPCDTGDDCAAGAICRLGICQAAPDCQTDSECRSSAVLNLKASHQRFAMLLRP
jgi:hypothetical protein